MRGCEASASSISDVDNDRAARSATPSRSATEAYGQPDATSDTHRDTCSAVSSRDRSGGSVLDHEPTFVARYGACQ